MITGLAITYDPKLIIAYNNMGDTKIIIRAISRVLRKILPLAT